MVLLLLSVLFLSCRKEEVGKDLTIIFAKSCGVSFLIAYSGTYTEEILSGKWTAIHKVLN